MRWAKVVLIAVGALIAFIVVESVFHLLKLAFIVLVIGAIIAVAVKAHSQYRLAREHRAQVREQKAERKARVTERPVGQVVAAPEWRQVENVPSSRHGDVEDDLARLKRELGAQ